MALMTALVGRSYKVQLIHKFTKAEAPEELRVSESMPSRSESSPEAADGAPDQATYEYARWDSYT